MRISIVTISFNQAQFLESAILSVIQQDYPELEYIVVDPGSTDGSRDIIEKYRDRISKVIYEKDAGAADGLNKGFAHATGDVYGFLNSDDELLPGALSHVAMYMQQHPGTDVVSGCGYFIDADGARLRRVIPSRLTPWLYIHGAVTVFQQGTFFRAACYKKTGGFNIENQTCWDGELFLDMGMAGACFDTMREDIAHFRLHAGGITGSGRMEECYRKDSARLFIKGTGRARNQLDILQDFLARIMKGVLDPAYYPRRLVIFLKKVQNSQLRFMN